MTNDELQNRYLTAKHALFDKYYGALNDMQRRAVYNISGPLLILAGAGSGKTTVLVNRIGYIIKYGNAYNSGRVPENVSAADVKALELMSAAEPAPLAAPLTMFAESPCPPWAVLAITFTNKAAKEIKNRLSTQFDDESVAHDIWSGTFHSVCMRILRKYGDRVGYGSGFGVCDTDDAKKLIITCMRELKIDDKNLPVRSVANAISRAKDKLMTPEDYLADAGADFKQKQLAVIYAQYQKRLSDANLLDFDDIIMQTVRLLEENDDVRDYYSRRFRYVCVDEYQDTNKAQLKLTLLLSSYYHNIMVVGDDDQSIYKFRGAVIENILNFDSIFDKCEVIRLEQNYRSTSTILDAANAVIANNTGRKGKKLWTSGETGELISVKTENTESDESRAVMEKIRELVASGKYTFRDFAVLYRVNAQSRSLETVFAKSGIPYLMIGSLRFYDRKEIKDVISYLCVIANPRDNLRLRRIVNEPKRKIGDASLTAAETIAAETDKPVLDILRNAGAYAAIPKLAAAKMQEFAEIIDNLIAMKDAGTSVFDIINAALDLSGYRQMLIDGGEGEVDRLENIDELISAAKLYDDTNEEPSLPGYLEDVALVSDIDRYDENANAVVLMTIHSAKGLEFPVVFLPGMEEGLFPGMQSIMNPEETEEERRLAYVALTRAKERIFISHVRQRLLYGRTQYYPVSRFVTEIPTEYTDAEEDENGETAVEYNKAPLAEHQSQSRFGNKRHPEYSNEAKAVFGLDTDGNKRTSSVKAKAEQFVKEVAKNASAKQFAEGARVKHNLFGSGCILSVKQMGGDTLYEIAFDNVGTKKLMASFAKLKADD